MYFWRSTLQFFLVLSGALTISAASTWGVSDATVSIHARGAGVGAGLKKQYDSLYLILY